MEEHPDNASKVLDAAAAKREARMKKILENSNKRLQVLTGKEYNSEGNFRLTAS